MKNWKKVLFIIVGILLIALAVVLIIQAVHYDILDHNLQIAERGFYKNDVTMLTYGQRAAEVCCWIFGSVSAIVGVGSELAAFEIIGL